MSNELPISVIDKIDIHSAKLSCSPSDWEYIKNYMIIGAKHMSKALAEEKERHQQYIKVMKLAGVPETIIQNPNIINSAEITPEDLCWAKSMIDKRMQDSFEK